MKAIQRFFQSLAAMVLKVVLRLVPTRVKAAIAVSPDSSRIRLKRRVRNRLLLG
jgi:hypothetical protein